MHRYIPDGVIYTYSLPYVSPINTRKNKKDYMIYSVIKISKNKKGYIICGHTDILKNKKGYIGQIGQIDIYYADMVYIICL